MIPPLLSYINPNNPKITVSSFLLAYALRFRYCQQKACFYSYTIRPYSFLLRKTAATVAANNISYVLLIRSLKKMYIVVLEIMFMSKHNTHKHLLKKK